MNEDAICTQDLTCRFGNRVAVDHLNLQVPRGIVFGFLGQNGAGKTTTIRMLLGLLEPSEGSAQVLGFGISNQGQAIRERTGALMEHNGLYERMTAAENLEYFGRIYRLTEHERKQRIQELLTHLCLWERRHELVGTWSKGMRQKLAVARCLLHHPPLVFLDEPTSGLDPLATVELRADLQSLKAKDGMTIFLNTHNLSEAEKLCDLVGILHQGRLLVVAPPKKLMTLGSGPQLEITGSTFNQTLVDRLRMHPGVRQAELAENVLLIRPTEEQAVDSIIALVAQAGGQIQNIQRGASDLEAVFINLVAEQGV
jgi:ABC-2 type transport system ATP-binding protein